MYARALARRIPDGKLIRATAVVAGGCIASNLLGVLASSLYMLMNMDALPWGASANARVLTWAYMIAAAVTGVFYALGLVVLWRYRRRFSEASSPLLGAD